MSKRVLLVGSSFSAAPIYFALKKRGYTVAVCGKNKTDPCHQYSDESFFVDYSDRDALLSLVLDEGFKFIVPSCNDYAYMSCAWIADMHGMPGYDTYDKSLIIHTKDEFRKYTNESQIPAPRSNEISDIKNFKEIDVTFPALVKPVDSFSGRGVAKIFSYDDLEVAIREARDSSRQGGIVLEDFVEGNLCSHTAFIKGGEFIYDTFVDEYCSVYPYQVDCSNHPSVLGEELKGSMRNAMINLVKELNLVDGLLHTQLITNGDEFWVIECMRRCPGDLYSKLISYSTGINYIDLYISSFVNEEALPVSSQSDDKFIGRHTVSINKPLICSSFSMSFPCEWSSVVPLKNSGERMEVAPYDKLAIVFTEFRSASEMMNVTPCMADYVSIESLEG